MTARDGLAFCEPNDHVCLRTLPDGPPWCLIAARGAPQRQAVAIEMEHQIVSADHAAEAPHGPPHPLNQPRHHIVTRSKR